MPAEGERRRLHIDEDLMVDCFERLEGETEPSRLNFRYVVALLLMRRKRFKFVEVRTEDDQEVLHLRCARTRNHYRVVNPRLTDGRCPGGNAFGPNECWRSHRSSGIRRGRESLPSP